MKGVGVRALVKNARHVIAFAIYTSGTPVARHVRSLLATRLRGAAFGGAEKCARGVHL